METTLLKIYKHCHEEIVKCIKNIYLDYPSTKMSNEWERKRVYEDILKIIDNEETKDEYEHYIPI